jgi:probable DNA repair protein
MLPKTSDTIICMTENQVHDIRLLYKQQIQKKSIRLPSIYSLNRWLKKEYQEFCMIRSINESYSILNGIEEKLLWEKIIYNGLKKENFQKRQIDNITEKVINADRLIREYKITDIELKNKDNWLSHEVHKFNKWRDEFNSYCVEQKLLSRLRFIEFFIGKQREYKIINKQELLIVGFDNKSPLYQKLIDTLAEKNKVKDYKNKENKIKRRQKIVCKNIEDEIKEVTQWVKENPKKKLLIISPELSRFQIKLQNEIDRQIQPNIYNEYDKNNIYNSNLQRPLSNEPIITAAISLLKLNYKNQNNTKLIYESLLFNNWIDKEGYKDREQLANYINNKKFPKISINSLLKLIKNDPKINNLNLNSLTDILSLILKNQKLWVKKKGIDEWINLTEQYWSEIKISKENNLLSFEINNIESLFKLLNQVKNNQVINHSITFEEYWEILFTQLENTPAPKEENNSFIDINGFAENPIKKYDAIWLMNMNTNFWPGKIEFNPFIPKKLQKKYHIYDEVYTKKIDEVRLNRLKTFSADITISYSEKDGEKQLIPTPGYFEELKAKKTSSKINKNKNHNIEEIEEIEDDKAPEILGSEIPVSGGFRCLENYQKCPAWAFYENRLHLNSFQEDEQDEISKISRGNLIHEFLEKFWKKHKNSINLANMSKKVLQQNIETLINEVIDNYKINKPHLTPSQIKLESTYYKDLLYQWLIYEKTIRPRFSVIEYEKKYKIKIGRMTFNVKIDRIDQYEDGSRLLIDYKTGAKKPISQWKIGPTSLQMPIYVTYAGIKDISAAGIGYVHNNDVKLIGLSSYSQNPIDGELKDCSSSKKDEDQWQYLVNFWRTTISDLASKFLSGDAKMVFEKDSDLENCTVKPLLRIAESIWLFEKEKNDE